MERRDEGTPRNVLVVCSTHRDHRELPLLARPDTTYLFHDDASVGPEDLIGKPAFAEYAATTDPLVEAERILAMVEGKKISAVISTDDYPGSALAAVIAKALGLPGPEPEANLICQHKYLSRLIQAEFVPDSVPPFALIDVADDADLPGEIAYPAFVKPVKSFFSIGARTVASRAELAALKRYWVALDQFFVPLERLLERYTGTSVGTKRLIAEGMLQGEQVTVEGYAHGGETSVMGVVDSIMFPGTLAFARFDYPSALPKTVQARMVEMATALMGGLGFDNGLFNIEMMYDAAADRISIIEINPRMASQFADLYEKVDGTNSYEVLLAIAEGRKPEFKRRQGKHKFASSCVLRSFEDHVVAALPSDADLARIARGSPAVGGE